LANRSALPCSSTAGAEDDHFVRARIVHGLQERGHVGKRGTVTIFPVFSLYWPFPGGILKSEI
jgi:hypothetical protein